MPSAMVFVFLSTPSARRATCRTSSLPADQRISIHALCEEGDHKIFREYGPDEKFLSTPSARRATLSAPCRMQTSGNFYPRPLRGGRLSSDGQLTRPPIFLSTPSARRATASRHSKRRARRYFYPRPLRGGRPPDQTPCSTSENFYPRPLRGGRRIGTDAAVISD